MTGREAIDQIKKEKGILQADLAKLVGMKNQSNVSEALKRDMKLSVFVRFIDALGYRVVIEKKTSGRPEKDLIVLTADKKGDD